MTDEAGRLLLRDVIDSDLPAFFEHQRDAEACRLAAFPSRERDAFMEHWSKILRDDAGAKRTILVDDRVVGNIVSFERDGEWEVGYWIDRAHWGKGIATRALAEFLTSVQRRPLYGYVAKHNTASLRVLEKCGFVRVGEQAEFSTAGGETIPGWILRIG